MATSDYMNGTRLSTALSGVSKYVNDVYFNLSGDTMKANLTLRYLYTNNCNIAIGEGGASSKRIWFNTPQSGTSSQSIHNLCIIANDTSNKQGIGIYDNKNSIWPFYYNVATKKVITQCPWRQDFLAVLGESETENTSVGTSAVVLPMTRCINDVTDLNMLSSASKGVKVNRSCLVEVTARVYFSTLAQGVHANIWIHETGEGFDVAASSVQGQGVNTAVSISPIAVWLNAGSVLQLKANVGSGTAVVNESHTYMTVKVIGGAKNS